MRHGVSRNKGKIERGRSEVCVYEWMLRRVMVVGERVASVIWSSWRGSGLVCGNVACVVAYQVDDRHDHEHVGVRCHLVFLHAGARLGVKERLAGVLSGPQRGMHVCWAVQW